MATLQWIIQVFLFPMELLAAALLYTHSRKPRTTSNAAGVLCIALFILLSMWSNTLPLFWSFAAIYGIALVLEWMYFQVSILNAVYDITFTYATQHLAFQLANIIQQAFGFEGHVQMVLIHLPVYAVIYYVAKRAFAPAVQDMERFMPDKVQPVIAMTLMLLVAVILSVSSYYCIRSGDLRAIYMVCSLYAAVCCVFVLWVQYNMSQQLRLWKKLNFQQQLWLQSRQQYLKAKEGIQLINKRCHELKKQIEELKASCESAPSQELLDNVMQLISIYDLTVKTGNDTVDMVLTEKSFTCNQYGISLTCVADGGAVAFVDSVDLYTLLSNLLDCTISFVMKLPEKKTRAIALKIFRRVDIAFLQVELYGVENAATLLDAKNETQQSYMLRSIQCTAEKYDGLLAVSTTEEEAVLRVSMPIPCTTKK